MSDFQRFALPLAAALLSACASTVVPPAPSADLVADCGELLAAWTRADEAHHDALDRQQDAWKAVVPVAVAARYASAKSDAETAARQRLALQSQAAALACPGQEG